jgi:tetratricopeptide (TPR) repeat protein
MRREDHIGDPLGALFLGTTDDAARRLAEYFGEKVAILKLEIVENELQVEIECYRFPDESTRMLAAGIELQAKGLLRAARTTFSEALVLDPLNPEALLALAMMHSRQKDYNTALLMLKRALVTGGDRVDVLRALADLCVETDQAAVAIGYLKRAAELAPDDESLRTAMAQLQLATPETPGASEAAASGPPDPTNGDPNNDGE